jgi:hypothetical protein
VLRLEVADARLWRRGRGGVQRLDPWQRQRRPAARHKQVVGYASAEVLGRLVLIADPAQFEIVSASESASIATIAERVDASAIVHADEAARRDKLHAIFLTKRVNREWAYSRDEACTNQAESFFSRIRRSQIGIHHHLSGPCLAAYSREMAWREDHRRVSNGEQWLAVASLALAHPVSRQWKGYWQRQSV